MKKRFDLPSRQYSNTIEGVRPWKLCFMPSSVMWFYTSILFISMLSLAWSTDASCSQRLLRENSAG